MGDRPAQVAELVELARDALAQALRGARAVALVNFPNHGNPGDPAIWLGTRRLLNDLGVRVVHSTAWWDLDVDLLRRRAGAVPVLLNGGGNFGDLYAGQQSAREAVLAGLRDRPVVQLPQSIHFADPAREQAMAQLLADHPDVVLMVREENAARIARDRLGVTPLLSPDHALASGPMRRTRTPDRSILWLARMPGDPEYVPYAEPTGDDVTRVEWLHGVPEDQAAWDLRGRLLLRVNAAAQQRWTSGRRSAALQSVAASTFAPLARRWVARGVDILSAAEVVVTDKLHGHIFCALLGIPHVVLDNSYGKVSGTLDAWTGGLPGVHRAADGAEALALARELVEGGRR